MAQLHSLIDLLKKNLYYAEGLSLKELTKLVHEKMLQDYSSSDVENFILSCLNGNDCFYCLNNYLWYLDKKGIRENDEFYNKLFKEQMALKFSDAKTCKTSKAKKKKNNKVIQLTMNLVPDGRFVQHDGGKWGLTEWEVNPQNYRIRTLVIKVLANNSEGLTLKEIVERVGIWKSTHTHVIKEILRKYPYFLYEGDLWSYNAILRSIYEQMIEKHIISLRRQKLLFFQEKSSLIKSLHKKDIILKELHFAKEQTAAALAEQISLVEDYDHIVQRFAEKDLLLSLRKRELIKCKQEKQKIENKANSILYECRKWVESARNLEQENDWLTREAKELKDAEDQLLLKVSELKDKHASEKADLIRENINLKHQIERQISRSKKIEKDLRMEISRLGIDLKTALQESEERRYSLETVESQLNQAKKELRQMKKNMTNPLVKLGLKIANIFSK